MYQNLHGRFTAPDPLLGSASAINPQTFNRYIYTGNNPANYTDPSGLNWCRNTSSGATNFVEGRTQCDGGWKDADNSVVEITAGDWSKEKAKVGDTVILNSNGSVTVVNSPEAKAIAQGQSVVSATVEVSGQGATEAASATLTTQGSSVSGTFTPMAIAGLPPCPPAICGSVATGPPLIDLTEGASAHEVQALLDVVGMTEIPVISQAADITSGVISLTQGDTVGGVLSLGAAVPGGRK